MVLIDCAVGQFKDITFFWVWMATVKQRRFKHNRHKAIYISLRVILILSNSRLAMFCSHLAARVGQL